MWGKVERTVARPGRVEELSPVSPEGATGFVS